MSEENGQSWNRLMDDLRAPLSRVQDQMNDWVDEYGRCHGANPRRVMQQRLIPFSPRIMVRETPEYFLVSVEVPGMEVGDLDITIDENRLVLRGEKKTGEDEGEIMFSELLSGKFKRSVPFDEDIDESRVSAKVNRGVLLVTVPRERSAADKGRKIDITE